MFKSKGKGENHSDSDSDTECKHVKVFAVSTFMWRIIELGALFHCLNRKYKCPRTAKSNNITRQRKKIGIISKCQAPDDAPSFALA